MPYESIMLKHHASGGGRTHGSGSQSLAWPIRSSFVPLPLVA